MKTVQVKKIEFGSGIPKIMTPVMGSSENEILSALKDVHGHAADAVEFRADVYRNLKDGASLTALLGKFREAAEDLPVLFTLRTKEEGGEVSCTPEEYTALNGQAIESGSIDMIDLQMQMHPDALISRAHAAGVKVILSQHDFSATPPTEEIVKILNGMEEAGADIAKIACMPQDETDVLHLLTATRLASAKMTIPILTISMGEMGTLSRVSGEMFGSCATFAVTGKASAPGQLDADKLSVILTGLHREKMADGHIFLIGFMGAGKTTTARALAAISGKTVYELDEEITENAGMPIPEIFAEKGEQDFRDLESAALLSMQGREPGIVSCGGGIILRSSNTEAMKRMGTIVLLKASAETVEARIRQEKGSRPVLNGHRDMESMKALMASRADAYEEAADIQVDTDGRTPEEIAKEILFKVENRNEIL